MKVTQGLRSADNHRVERLLTMGRSLLNRLGIRRPSKRERYEAAIRSSTITPAQRQTAFENSAKNPRIGAGLDRAEQAREDWLKGQQSGELHRPARPASPPRR